MRVRDVMNAVPAVAHAADDLREAANRMVSADVPCLPVVREGRLVGVLEARDMVAHPGSLHERGTSVEAVMQRRSDAARLDDDIRTVAARLHARRASGLPVVDDGRVVGVVTARAILAVELGAALARTHIAGPTVAETMTRNPMTTHPDDYLLDAAATMRQFHIRHLPVIDGGGKVIGMLSDRDVRTAIGDIRYELGEETRPEVELLRVADVMSSPAITTSPAQSCSEVAREFVSLDASALPVVDAGGELVGLISYVDLLRALAH